MFLILGNQLFNTQYLKGYSDYTFYMSEDHGLCTFEKHHKLKILLFLSSMRSYQDEIDREPNDNYCEKNVEVFSPDELLSKAKLYDAE